MKVLEVTEVDIVQEAKELSKMPGRDRFARSDDYTIFILLNGTSFPGSDVLCVFGGARTTSSIKSFFSYKNALNYFNELVKKYNLKEKVI